MRLSDAENLSRGRLTRIYCTGCRGHGWARTYGLNFPILPTARPKLSLPYTAASSPPSIAFTSSSDSRSAMIATRSPAPSTVFGIGMVSGSFAGPWA